MKNLTILGCLQLLLVLWFELLVSWHGMICIHISGISVLIHFHSVTFPDEGAGPSTGEDKEEGDDKEGEAKTDEDTAEEGDTEKEEVRL